MISELLAKLGLKIATGDYSLAIGIKKGLKRLILLALTHLASLELNKYGITLSVDADTLTLILYGLVTEPLRNLLKQKLPILAALL